MGLVCSGVWEMSGWTSTDFMFSSRISLCNLYSKRMIFSNNWYHICINVVKYISLGSFHPLSHRKHCANEKLQINPEGNDSGLQIIVLPVGVSYHILFAYVQATLGILWLLPFLNYYLERRKQLNYIRKGDLESLSLVLCSEEKLWSVDRSREWRDLVKEKQCIKLIFNFWCWGMPLTSLKIWWNLWILSLDRLT